MMEIKMGKCVWMVSGMLFFVWMPGFVCPENSSAQNQDETFQKAEKRENAVRMRVSDIMGEKVKNLKGDVYGTVGDMVLHRNGTVDYIILLHGGILGLGERLVPIPWNRVVTSKREGFLVVDVGDELLKNAPNFSEEDWQKFDKDEWVKEIENYFGK